MSSIPKKRVYNLIRQEEDPRDHLVARSAGKYIGLTLPKFYDLREFCPPVYKQEIGDCTANAAAAAYYMEINKKK